MASVIECSELWVSFTLDYSNPDSLFLLEKSVSRMRMIRMNILLQNWAIFGINVGRDIFDGAYG